MANAATWTTGFIRLPHLTTTRLLLLRPAIPRENPYRPEHSPKGGHAYVIWLGEVLNPASWGPEVGPP
jgi:hypothetical protein